MEKEIELKFEISSKNFKRLKKIAAKRKDCSIDEILKKITMDGIKNYSAAVKKIAAENHAA